MNKAVLVGRLTHDPELMKSQRGNYFCQFTIAINRRTKDEEKTDFLDCVVFNEEAKNLSMYMKKGSLISVMGSLQVEDYETKEGEKRRSAKIVVNEIVFLESKKSQESRLKSNDEDFISSDSSDDMPY